MRPQIRFRLVSSPARRLTRRRINFVVVVHVTASIHHPVLSTTLMTSPLDPPANPSSPTSPRTATARVRIKAQRRTDSLIILPSTERHGQRTRSLSQSQSTIPTTERSDIPPASPNAPAAKRRQSSIAYYTPASPSPWSQRLQLNTSLPPSVDGHGEPIVANGKETTSKRSSLVLSSRSPSTRESVSSLDAAGAREREPLTLVEK